MNYYDLNQQLAPLIVFSLQDIFLVCPSFRQATLYDWEKTGKVVKLRNNCYVFSDFVPENDDYYLLSNLVYQPSYVSTELALNHYGVIPETVTVMTAITTNKTQSFTTAMGTFSYQTLRPDLFFGYTLVEVRKHGVQIAFLEKAVLDYLYLNTDVDSEEAFSSLRWNKQILRDEIHMRKLEKYLAIFTHNALSERVHTLYKYLKV
ncbi:MAG: hypothetical protein A2632_02160 [Candidatus Pacebacteria bacterium RIFCSPHIGHO2_01_FULL_46_16]|nr:MAG: hypothetical protein A3E86_04805 [Candidatus Daviesbacteria bacterium RIFCSPHIGHO2_12_FULL_47_45]OGJ15736.1 MAG: hypothetical protein A2632_02160 [Candidatus Pacebacteria bacterium RIFCSPHIGHO2_01_FULL_46_16]OGJ38191.1 MAG: hypothetical protein A3A82_01120 [Candidatus Pacebacteria bacterium RIFCSPLOWO2_01_FULL_47_12]